MKSEPDTVLIVIFKNAFCRAFCNRKKCKGCPIENMDIKQYKTVQVKEWLK